MRKIAIIASLFCLAVLSSCELKDELTGTQGEKSEMGALELAVSVSQGAVESRANTQAPGEYPVIITNKETEEGAYNGTYESMEKPLSLPVGTYVVASHTPGEIQTTMSSPYYGGEKELSVTKGITSVLEVVCKMLNTQITLVLGEDFKTAFKEWTITLNDGASHVLTFTQDDVENNTRYWYLGADSHVATLTMDITAVTTDGVKVRDQKQFTKADANENYENDNPNFTGGDVLNINIGAIEEPDPEPGQKPQLGFDISVDITFDGRDETVEIPVEDVPTTDPEPGEPDEPVEDVITISDGGTGYLTDGVIVTDGKFPTDVNVIMGIEKGIQNVFVKVSTTNSVFEGMVAELGLVAGDGMDLASSEASALAELFPLPEAGATEYTFSMSEMLFTMLNGFEGKHDFTLKVVDKEGNEKSAVLTITVNK